MRSSRMAIAAALTLTLTAGALGAVAVPSSASVTVETPGTITRQSVTSAGAQLQDNANLGAMSPDGRYLAFSSASPTLRPDGLATGNYLYLRDTVAGTTELIRPTVGDQPAIPAALDVSLSQDARYVAFSLQGTSIDPTAPSGTPSAYLLDRASGTLTRLTADLPGGDAAFFVFPIVTPDGRYVTIVVGTQAAPFIESYRYEVATGQAENVARSTSGAVATGGSYVQTLSPDGRYAAYAYYGPASDIVGGESAATNQFFLRDYETGTTTWLNRGTDGLGGGSRGIEGASFSRDGRYLVMDSRDANLVPGDTNGSGDVFLYDLRDGSLERVSTRPDGTQSAGFAFGGMLLDDGRTVAFLSTATDLTPGEEGTQRDQFLKDLVTGDVVRVITTPAGERANAQSAVPSNRGPWAYIAEGEMTRLVFASAATNLVADDTNGISDIFTYDLAPVAGPAPRIDGARFGAPLTAVAGTYAEGVRLAYQWTRDGEPIPGATSATYRPVAGDVGRSLGLQVTASQFAHSPLRQQASPVTVQPGVLTTRVPVVKGTLRVGRTVTAVPGRWTAGTRFTYRWFADGRPIARATAATLSLSAKTRGKRITVTVTGSAPGYTPASVTSKPSRPVR